MGFEIDEINPGPKYTPEEYNSKYERQFSYDFREPLFNKLTPRRHSDPINYIVDDYTFDKGLGISAYKVTGLAVVFV
ncbi:uncharacterized protein PRCAT00001412001 [Priceomyces carsonii]|uniref:uncharacterized protein n=1 Tax=Priceomyces carsonii TaxID=28549 RepID=UPI002ED884AA|nr:unnamed protein product [Priceomyces carsonii]